MGCRCNDILRANEELTQCTTGMASITVVETNVTSAKTQLSTIAQLVSTGAYSANGSAIEEAIENMLTHVETAVSRVKNDFDTAQTVITSQRDTMQTEDTTWHRIQAEAAHAGLSNSRRTYGHTV